VTPVEIPPYIRPHEVARACGMQTQTARKMLRRAGILEKLGGACVVADSRLRERLPDVYDRVYGYFANRASERIRESTGRYERIPAGPPTTE
jgi:hypothetical protein